MTAALTLAAAALASFGFATLMGRWLERRARLDTHPLGVPPEQWDTLAASEPWRTELERARQDHRRAA